MRLMDVRIRRPGLFFAGLLATAIAAAALESAVAALRGRWAEPGRGASWIWASADGTSELAFFAVRDFTVDVPGAAQMAITADESYIVYLNGRRVGSGAYRRGAPADLYDVAADLKAGTNRLAVELASSRGGGGLLASLRLDGRPAVVTGDDWRVFRRFDHALLRGWPLAGGEAPEVWRSHPTGRWRVAPPAPRPTPPIGFPPRTAGAVRLREPWAESQWRELDTVKKRELPKLGPRLFFDWGREVTGFLELELASSEAETGLLWFGSEPPEAEPPADAIIIPVPGRGLWADVHPRTFRYVYVVGVELARVPEVWPIAPELASQLAPPDSHEIGVYGLEPLRPDTLAEEEVRRRLVRRPPEPTP